MRIWEGSQKMWINLAGVMVPLSSKVHCVEERGGTEDLDSETNTFPSHWILSSLITWTCTFRRHRIHAQTKQQWCNQTWAVLMEASQNKKDSSFTTLGRSWGSRPYRDSVLEFDTGLVWQKKGKESDPSGISVHMLL